MPGDDSCLSLRAPARETVFRPFPLASPSGPLYIERMFLLRSCINQSINSLSLSLSPIFQQIGVRSVLMLYEMRKRKAYRFL